jgi:hypothetical protein
MNVRVNLMHFKETHEILLHTVISSWPQNDKYFMATLVFSSRSVINYLGKTFVPRRYL